MKAAKAADAEFTSRSGIRLGGRREGATTAPEMPAAAPIEASLAALVVPEESEEAADEGASERRGPRVAVPKPTRRDALSAELEMEMAAALGGAALDQLLSKRPDVPDLEVDSRRRSFVVRIHGDNVFFSLGGRHEGVASLRQFKEPPAIGEPMDVIVSSFNQEDGLYELRVPGAAIQVGDWEDLAEGSVVDARVSGSNTGGLEVLVNSLRGFIPASQISIYRVENLNEFIGQRLTCVVTEVNALRRKLVLSRRAILEREQQEQRQALLAELKVGEIREGVVRSLRDFGAFVDLGGIDGLIHVSQMSWDRVKHPSEVMQEGQRIKVKVEKIDPETGKISLAYRDLMTHPWTDINERFPVNATVKGVVTRITKFGAFVKLAPGIEGLVHISELSHRRVLTVSNVVREGQEVEVKILSVDAENGRMGLSMKAAQPAPAQQESAAKEEPVDEPPREMAVPKHQGPLKGGTSRASGGDKFGLKW